MRSAVLLLVCLGALALSSSVQAAWVNPCDKPLKRHYTTIENLAGVWEGHCVQKGVPANASTDAGMCIDQVYDYPYTIVYNGMMAGANISGTVLPLGSVTVADSMPIDRTYRAVQLNFPVAANVTALGAVYTQVTCYNGVPTYTEATIHRLAHVYSPTAFPLPLKRDWNLWCNDSEEEMNEHAPMSFNIVCQATYKSAPPASWP